MKRREFLRRGAYGAAGAALVGSAGLGAAGFAGAAGEPEWRGFGASGFAERMAAPNGGRSKSLVGASISLAMRHC